jgi:hypothetical protein
MATFAHDHDHSHEHTHGHQSGSLETHDETDGHHCLLAVPKKGRLNEECMKLLRGIGVDYRRVRPRETTALCHCRFTFR